MKHFFWNGLQDDLLYENLTVYETLYYAAMLRLPRSMTTEEKVGRVDAVIDTLGLFKCKDTIIGGGLKLNYSPLFLPFVPMGLFSKNLQGVKQSPGRT